MSVIVLQNHMLWLKMGGTPSDSPSPNCSPLRYAGYCIFLHCPFSILRIISKPTFATKGYTQRPFRRGAQRSRNRGARQGWVLWLLSCAQLRRAVDGQPKCDKSPQRSAGWGRKALELNSGPPNEERLALVFAARLKGERHKCTEQFFSFLRAVL